MIRFSGCDATTRQMRAKACTTKKKGSSHMPSKKNLT